METIFPTIILIEFDSIIVLLLLIYLYSNINNKFLKIWAISWIFLIIRFIFTLLKLIFDNLPIFSIFSNMMSLSNALFLYIGTINYQKKKLNIIIISLFGIDYFWIVFSILKQLNFLFISIPTYFLIGIAYIYIGITLLQSKKHQSIGTKIISYSFILWGIHKLDYPFLRPVGWTSSLGFLITNIIQQILVFGMIITIFEVLKRKNNNELNIVLSVIEHIPHPILIFDTNRIIRKWNIAGEELLNLFNIKKKKIDLLEFYKHLCKNNDEKLEEFDEIILDSETSCDMNSDIVLPNGIKIDREIIISLKNIKGYNLCGVLILFSKNIHDKKSIIEKNDHLEEKYLKLRGIIHDFNNFLQVIFSMVSYIEYKGDINEEFQGILKKIIDSGKKISNLSGQILDLFKDEEKPDFKVGNIYSLILESSYMAIHESQIKLKLKRKSVLYEIKYDEKSLFRVFFNILINAKQSMPDGGKITIICENSDLDYPNKFNLPIGKYIVIRIRDEGVGIAPENLPHIFEPNFTTKESGTGLGLHISKKIINNHDGYIFCESEIGKGTEFMIYFPKYQNNSK